MSDQADTLGGRLPLADPAALNPAQREIFDRMATRLSRGPTMPTSKAPPRTADSSVRSTQHCSTPVRSPPRTH